MGHFSPWIKTRSLLATGGHLLCLIFLFFLAACSGPFAQAPTSLCASSSSTPVTLTLAYTTEKQAWMKDVVTSFNQQHLTACDGPITVQTIPNDGSGQSIQSIIDGTIKPDIWSP